MTLHSLDIPDEPELLPAFLDDRLSGTLLPELVAELRAAEVSDGRPVILSEVLGPDRSAFLMKGSSAVPADRLRLLLAHPDLLLELQELIFAEGGEYWLKRLKTPEVEAAAASVWTDIAADLPSNVQPRASTTQGTAGRRRTWMMVVAAAAVVLIAGLLIRPQKQTVAWGWDRPGVFDVEMGREAYLKHLAETANEWFNKTPATADQLAQRMREFRQGCDDLQQAAHPQLPADDRAWLVERCRVWSDKIDQLSSDLAAGRKSADAVQTEMNDMTTKLMSALRQRAVTT